MRTADDHALECRDLLAHALHLAGDRSPDLLSVHDPELTGRISAASVFSELALPPFANSQMDGFAVNSADLADASAATPVILAVGFTTAAGDPPVAHAPGTASPIMTGAAIPRGADAVVPIEQAEPPEFPRLARAGEWLPDARVAFTAPVPVGQFIRAKGSDLLPGAEIIRQGVRLTPSRIGALASAGVRGVTVASRVRVLLCGTGDEVTVGADALEPGQIHDSNTPMLAAALRSAGAEVRIARSGDSVDALVEALTGDWLWADVVVTTGGISAGAFEVVREALAPIGARFVKVAMQPGGPQGLGTVTIGDRAVPVLCFPGNPVSAMLSAELFLLPALRHASGLPEAPQREQLLLAEDVTSPAEKLQLRRGCLTADGRVTLTGPSSHLLVGLANADVIAELPIGVSEAAENTTVTVWRINV